MYYHNYLSFNPCSYINIISYLYMSQLFKNKVPSSVLFDFLTKHTNTKLDYYIFNKTAYKTAKYHNHTSAFLSYIVDYYHDSKKYYATRDDSYNNFLTIIRQICKHNSIAYTSRKEYLNSTYNISYHIYKH